MEETPRETVGNAQNNTVITISSGSIENSFADDSCVSYTQEVFNDSVFSSSVDSAFVLDDSGSGENPTKECD